MRQLLRSPHRQDGEERQMAVMLNKVRVAMGDAAFYDALKDYYATFKFKRASPSDLLNTLQKHSKADLTAIFAQYLGY